MKKEDMKTSIYVYGMRLPSDDKAYYLNQLKRYAQHIANERANVRFVSFGSHDQRGGIEIVIGFNDTTESRERGFFSKDELLGYVQGFNDAKGGF